MDVFSPRNITQALTLLSQGAVIAHATETCYGLACDLTNKAAVEKLFAIKQRPPDQPVSALFASVEQAKEYVEWNDQAEELAREYLPGPLTIILPLRRAWASEIFPALTPTQTLGIRVSPHPTAMRLAKEFGMPLSTTSANLHGLPNPYSVEDIINQYKDQELQPDAIIDDGRLAENAPSRIVIINDGKMKEIR